MLEESDGGNCGCGWVLYFTCIFIFGKLNSSAWSATVRLIDVQQNMVRGFFRLCEVMFMFGS